MSYNAEVVAHSKGPNRIQIVTLEITYPLIIHAELMTHKLLSRNTASNRAIPVERMIQSVIDDPFVPDMFPKTGKGMQPGGYWPTDSTEHAMLYEEWMVGRVEAVERARRMLVLGCHKEIVNRLLFPWLWTTMVVTSTHWANLMNLRCEEHAQRQAHKITDLIQVALFKSKPRELRPGEWHTPYVDTEEMGYGLRGPIWVEGKQPPMNDPDTELVVDPESFTRVGYYVMVSVGRCAGVSYLRQGKGKETHEAFDLACRIARPGHWSPFEHPAQAITGGREWFGNFFGWRQLRKMWPREHRTIFMPNLPETVGLPPWVDPSS